MTGHRSFSRPDLQEQVAKLGESLVAYPPMQEGASFDIDRVKEQTKAAIARHAGTFEG